MQRNAESQFHNSLQIISNFWIDWKRANRNRDDNEYLLYRKAQNWQICCTESHSRIGGYKMKITEQISVSDPYLLFVPSLLKPTFERDGLNTVSDLLSLHPSDFESRKGWGKRKTKLLIALQHLYRELTTCQSPIDELPITSFMGSELLPDATKPEMTTHSFINASADEFQLNGKKKADFDSLKQLLVEYLGASESMQNPESSYLQGFEYPEMDWRDVPLNVQSRVVGFLDRFQIVSLKQLDQLASTVQVTCPKTGKSLAALDQAQFGNKSLEDLRNELETLVHRGKKG